MNELKLHSNQEQMELLEEQVFETVYNYVDLHKLKENVNGEQVVNEYH